MSLQLLLRELQMDGSESTLWAVLDARVSMS